MIFMILRNDYIVEAILHMYTFWSFLASVHKVARLQAQQGTWNYSQTSAASVLSDKWQDFHLPEVN